MFPNTLTFTFSRIGFRRETDSFYTSKHMAAFDEPAATHMQ
jgi:hypothetical protein